MAKILDILDHGKAYLFNPINRSILGQNLPEIAFSQANWTLTGPLLHTAYQVLIQKMPDYPAISAWCYVPRHMIVFFDAKERVRAHVKICFSCNQFIAYPESYYTENGTAYFREIFSQLGVPIFADPEEHFDFFQQKPLADILFNKDLFSY
ncbi:MAG: hypothetical protein AAF587_37275 [Bacteroidota bacterium]